MVFGEIKKFTHLLSKETTSVASRDGMMTKLEFNQEYDVLVIGGGCVGAGVALDAALRGLNVICVEREDIASGTSSRSTKLLWGGSRYLVQAFVALFNQDLRLLRHPIDTWRKFKSEFKMVLNCHRERKFMLETQSHLTNWVPIAVPLTKWLLWPPPFDYPPAAIGPIGVFPLFFKFYDALSGFSCPPSHIMLNSRAIRKFPQLDLSQLKYCSIFYEGMHNDARTNLAIALTAAKHGATVLNYTEVVELLKDQNQKVIGAIVRDDITGKLHTIKSKSTIFCGGPFTDSLRKLEDPLSKNVVRGAGGIHIILPGFYAPKNFGLVDMNTSDGRFLFYLPWENHVLIGTTDTPTEPTMRPVPSEKDINWLLHEASKYLSTEVKLRREDVLSAWMGIRPLAGDPHADPSKTAAVSRDHVVSYNPQSGVIFLSGGKWTTYREMAEDGINKLIEVNPELSAKMKPCTTLETALVGKEGYTPNMSIRLAQQYNLPITIADHLVHTYGGRAEDVISIAVNELNGFKCLVPGYPYIEAEVIFAARHEWSAHPEDLIARRTRLAFLNKNAALSVIPTVVDIMGKELKWDGKRKQQEAQRAVEYMKQFGGPTPQIE